MSPGKLSAMRLDEKINEPIAEVRTEDVEESSPPRSKDRSITPLNNKKKIVVSRTHTSSSKINEED